MSKNEYRRAFIMLRAAEPGYGGHVRLERRALTGSLYFIVTAPQDAGALSAALVGRRGGEYYAAPIGPLSRDRRGQLTLAWQFDPRNVAGRPFEAYAWVTVVRTDAPAAVALIGNVEGSRELDPVALRRAALSAFAPAEEPAADLPEPDQTPNDDAGDVKIYTGSRARVCARERPASATPEPTMTPEPAATPEPTMAPEPAMTPEPAATPEASTAPEAAALSTDEGVMIQVALEETAQAESPQAEAPDAPAPACETPEAPPPTEAPPEEAPASPPPEAPQTAARVLGLDITRPWPGAAEPLRRLFATQAPMETPLEDGYTYVLSPMPEASGYGASLVGLKVRDGQPAAVRYALPARYAPEPPAGLEGYRWIGGSEGWWVLDEALT